LPQNQRQGRAARDTPATIGSALPKSALIIAPARGSVQYDTLPFDARKSPGVRSGHLERYRGLNRSAARWWPPAPKTRRGCIQVQVLYCMDRLGIPHERLRGEA